MISCFPCRQIGDFQITALSDGHLAAHFDLLSGITPAEAHSIQTTAGAGQPDDIHINCYLIRGRGQVILVDAGAGEQSDRAGQLTGRLARMGISPDQVDILLLTHCHPDHTGGLLDADNQPVFKRAILMLHPLEARYWQDDANLQKATPRAQRNFALVRQILHVYAERVHYFSDKKIAETIQPVWLPGHTPGHTGFRIEAAGKSLLIWGDVVHYPAVQAARPGVTVAFDIDPLQAEQTRRKLLQTAAREQLLIAGMHLDSSGFARIEPTESGYRITMAET